MAKASYPTKTIQPKVLRETTATEILWLPGAVSTLYTEGTLYAMAQDTGLPTAISEDTNEDVAVLICQKTMTTAGVTTPFPRPADFVGGASLVEEAARTLVPFRVHVARGAELMLLNIGAFTTDILAAYTSGTPSITLTVQLGGNDDSKGGLVYFYDGPGNGEANMAAGYTDGTAVQILVRQPKATLTTGTSVAILEGEGGGTAHGIHLLGRVDLADGISLTASDGGAGDGDYIVYGGWADVARYLAVGQLPVVRASALFLS